MCTTQGQDNCASEQPYFPTLYLVASSKYSEQKAKPFMPRNLTEQRSFAWLGVGTTTTNIIKC